MTKTNQQIAKPRLKYLPIKLYSNDADYVQCYGVAKQYGVYMPTLALGAKTFLRIKEGGSRVSVNKL